MARFEVIPANRRKPIRVLLLFPLAFGAALMRVCCLPQHGVWWRWPSAWGPVFVHAAWLLPPLFIGWLFWLLDELVAVEVGPEMIRVHRAIESIPGLEALFHPVTFPRSQWRLVRIPKGLMVGKVSSDPEFKWESERNFRCGSAAKSALDQWLTEQNLSA